MTHSDSYSPMVLSREDLYELAWSKPMSELAKDFGISDVALAKRCKRLGIPVPGRGYWARLDAGQTPYRPKLPTREPQWQDRAALAVTPRGADETDTAETSLSGSDVKDGAADAHWLAERISFEELEENRIEVPATPKSWDPAIREVREELESAAKAMRDSKKAAERYEKWPEWRKQRQTCEEAWKWRSSEDRGQRLRDTRRPLTFRVSLGTYRRALNIANALAIAGRKRGFELRQDEEQGRLVFSGHDAEIQMRLAEQLEERYRQCIGYDGKPKRERYVVPTGRIRISLQTGYREGPTFQDKETECVELMLNRTFVTMYRLIVKCWERDRADRAAELLRLEAERQRAEVERIRRDRERRALEERRRRRRLLREARRWTDAVRIREYVSNIQSADVNCRESIAMWAAWAMSIAESIDPTTSRLSTEGEQKCS